MAGGCEARGEKSRNSSARARGGQGDEAEIQRVLLDRLQHLGRVARADGDLQRRKALPQPAQHIRQQVDAGGGAGADANPPGDARRMRRQFLQRLAHRPLDAPRMGEQGHSGRGRPGTPAHALDQPHAEAAFELAELQADRRLGQAAPFRRGREAAQFHHVGEAAELVEAEIAHPKVFLMLCMRGQSFPHGAGGWKSPAMFLRTTAA